MASPRRADASQGGTHAWGQHGWLRTLAGIGHGQPAASRREPRRHARLGPARLAERRLRQTPGLARHSDLRARGVSSKPSGTAEGPATPTNPGISPSLRPSSARSLVEALWHGRGAGDWWRSGVPVLPPVPISTWDEERERYHRLPISVGGDLGCRCCRRCRSARGMKNASAITACPFPSVARRNIGPNASLPTSGLPQPSARRNPRANPRSRRRNIGPNASLPTSGLPQPSARRNPRANPRSRRRVGQSWAQSPPSASTYRTYEASGLDLCDVHHRVGQSWAQSPPSASTYRTYEASGLDLCDVHHRVGDRQPA